MIDFRRFSNSKKAFEFHRGDCLSVLQRMGDESVDSFITDPPYGIELKLGTRKRGHRSIAGDGRLEARKLWEDFIPHAARIAKPDTAHLFFGTWKSPWMHEIISRHFTVKGCIAWDKRIIGLGFYLRPRWEMIYYCHKGTPPRPVKAIADLWPFARKIRTQHPCEKPVDLLRQAVRFCSSPGQVICDPFAGIASTGVAALMEDRRFFGIELEARFHRLGLDRLRLATAG
jgi:adenine-specific DNA-methyltransferase